MLHWASLNQGLQHRQGADIQKWGLGKRIRGERELDATPNPWPGPRVSDFGARSPTRFSGERLPGVSQRAARGPFTKVRVGDLISVCAALVPVLSGAPGAQKGHPSRWRGRDPDPGASPPLVHPGPRNPLIRDHRRPEVPHCAETHSIDLPVAHLPGLKLLSALVAAVTAVFRQAEAAAARLEIEVASGSLAPQPNPRSPLFPPSCFFAPLPPIPGRLSAELAGMGVKAQGDQWGSASRLKPPVIGLRGRALLARRFGCACAMDSAARWYWQ